MKKFTICSLLALSVGVVSAQTKFDSGYIVTNDGQRMSCEIRNLDWKNNPTSFEYRSADSSEVKVAKIEDVSEFGASSLAFGLSSLSHPCVPETEWERW